MREARPEGTDSLGIRMRRPAAAAGSPHEEGVRVLLDRFREAAQGAGSGGEVAYGRFEIAAELGARLRQTIERVEQHLCLVHRAIGCRKSATELIPTRIDLTASIDEQIIQVVQCNGGISLQPMHCLVRRLQSLGGGLGGTERAFGQGVESRIEVVREPRYGGKSLSRRVS